MIYLDDTRLQEFDANNYAAAIPPTIYYSKVGLELSKLVFQGQKMSPPYVASRAGSIHH